jgi:flagellar biosynthesis/type III secretory pathway protein FliH
MAALQQQKRMEQYRFQSGYQERLREQRARIESDRNHDYSNDPYFYTAPSYRYKRGARYYQTNQYGADLLRQAVNHGYAEGFQAGRADRQDHWRSNYRASYAYQDANYGYTGYYVDQSEYNYYFREGFRRGYEDGYSNRYRYGRYSNGSYSVQVSILGVILKFQSLR